MTPPTPRPDMGQFADLRDGGNLPERRAPSGWWIIPAAVLAGMLFAALVNADPIGRTADQIVNPRLEGF